MVNDDDVESWFVTPEQAFGAPAPWTVERSLSSLATMRAVRALLDTIDDTDRLIHVHATESTLTISVTPSVPDDPSDPVLNPGDSPLTPSAPSVCVDVDVKRG